MLKNKLCSPDYFSNQNPNCFKSIINNTEFGNRGQSVGEKGACLACVSVHRKDNMVPFESSLSQWQALLVVGGFWIFYFIFFPRVLLRTQKHFKYFVQVCLRACRYASESCGSGRLSQPLVLAGYKEWMTPAEVPTATVFDIFIKVNARGIKPTQGGLWPLSPKSCN